MQLFPAPGPREYKPQENYYRSRKESPYKCSYEKVYLFSEKKVNTQENGFAVYLVF